MTGPELQVCMMAAYVCSFVISILGGALWLTKTAEAEERKQKLRDHYHEKTIKKNL